MNQNLKKIIEVNLWKMYNNFSREFIDNLNNNEIAKYILDINEINDIEINMVSNMIGEIKNYKKQLDNLNSISKIEQRSEEWYQMRQERLTASDTAQAIGISKYGSKEQLILKKVSEGSKTQRYGSGVPSLRHGIMFESMALRCYQHRYGKIKVHEFGLIPHPTLCCYGASPDGINDLGIMIEIKCPLKRIIDGTVPEQYRYQMMGQMAVCGLKECDYIECDIKEYDNLESYIDDIDNNEINDHGIILEMKNGKYIYSPAYYTKNMLVNWLNNEMNDDIKKICPWKLKKIEVQRIEFDENLWNDIVPKIETFWKEVQEAKKNKVKKYAILDDD